MAHIPLFIDDAPETAAAPSADPPSAETVNIEVRDTQALSTNSSGADPRAETADTEVSGADPASAGPDSTDAPSGDPVNNEGSGTDVLNAAPRKDAQQEQIRKVPAAQIKPAPWNLRNKADTLVIDSLAKSIHQNGLINALTVREIPSGQYEIVAGHRRYEACKQAGLDLIRVSVISATDREARRINLIENLERQDINEYDQTIGIIDFLSLSFEEASPKWADLVAEAGAARQAVEGILRSCRSTHPLIDEAAESLAVEPEVLHDIFAEVFGSKGQGHKRPGRRTFTSQRLRLLHLPDDIHDKLTSGELDYSKALELLKIKDDELRAKHLQTALTAGCTFNDLRAAIKADSGKPEESAEVKTLTTLHKEAARQTRYYSRLSKADQARISDHYKAILKIATQGSKTKAGKATK